MYSLSCMVVVVRPQTDSAGIVIFTVHRDNRESLILIVSRCYSCSSLCNPDESTYKLLTYVNTHHSNSDSGHPLYRPFFLFSCCPPVPPPCRHSSSAATLAATPCCHAAVTMPASPAANLPLPSSNTAGAMPSPPYICRHYCTVISCCYTIVTMRSPPARYRAVKLPPPCRYPLPLAAVAISLPGRHRPVATC